MRLLDEAVKGDSVLEVPEKYSKILLLQINGAFQHWTNHHTISMWFAKLADCYVLKISYQALESPCAASVTCRKVRFQNWKSFPGPDSFRRRTMAKLQSYSCVLAMDFKYLKKYQTMEAMVTIPRAIVEIEVLQKKCLAKMRTATVEQYPRCLDADCEGTWSVQPGD